MHSVQMFSKFNQVLNCALEIIVANVIFSHKTVKRNSSYALSYKPLRCVQENMAVVTDDDDDDSCNFMSD